MKQQQSRKTEEAADKHMKKEDIEKKTVSNTEWKAY